MKKEYLARIIAKDNQGLQMISAHCSNAKVKITDIKYLSKNKIFLLSLERSRKLKEEKLKVNSICKFEFIESVKSKNINQNNRNLVLDLITINLIKNKKNCEINLIFSNNEYITLYTEIIEVTLEDLKTINLND